MMASQTPTRTKSACQLCQHESLSNFVVPGVTELAYCERCGLYQFGPQAEKESYHLGYHAFYDQGRQRKLRTASVRLNRIASLLNDNKARLLDIGCSVGVTIEAARERGWEGVGVDVSRDAVEFCRQRGLNCTTSDGVGLPFNDESFDVVTSWHVIEHVADIRETLAEWRRVLRVGGVLAIETPDGSAPRVRIQGANYRRFWKPQHTYVFTPSTLNSFFAQAGFELLRQPMLGRLSDLPLSMRTYALGYQAQHGLKKLTGTRKAFQIFARRTDGHPQSRGQAAA